MTESLFSNRQSFGYSRISQCFKEPQHSSTRSQQVAIGPYAEPE
jgi:hypothetical protein